MNENKRYTGWGGLLGLMEATGPSTSLNEGSGNQVCELLYKMTGNKDNTIPFFGFHISAVKIRVAANAKNAPYKLENGYKFT